MKQYFVLSLFFIITLTTNIYPILEEKSPLNDSKSLVVLENKIKEYAKQKKYDSAIYFSKRLLKLSHDLSDSLFIAKSNFRLGFYYKKIDKYEKAFANYNNALKIYSSLGDSIQSANMLRSMANIQKGLGDFLGSQQTSIDGLEFLYNSSDFNKISSLYHIISVSLKEQGDLKGALEWNKKALGLGEKNKTGKSISPSNILIYKNTKANILAEQKEFNVSLRIFQGLLNDSLVLKSEAKYARVLANTARIKWLKNPTNEESEKQFLKSLEIRRAINSISGLISSNVHLSNYYNLFKPGKSLLYANDALMNANKLKNPVAILEALDLIIPLKKKLGFSLQEEAILYSKTQNELTKTQQKVRSIYAATKYDNDKLTSDNLLLIAQRAKKEQQNTLYLSGLILSIFGIGFVVYYKNTQKKRAKLEATYKTEIRLAKKIHDEVGNDIFYLMTQIKNKPNPLEEDSGFIVLEGLDKVYQKTRNISREYTPIKTDETFGEELRALLNSYGNDNIKIITNELDSGFWNSLDKSKKLEVFWIIRELMTNMRKYSKASFVGITFSKVRNQLELTYKDDGIGFTNKQNNWGNGLKHVETRIQNLKGSFNFDSEPSKGVTAKIKFPI